MKPALISYKIGNSYPYDDPQDCINPDWAVKAARGVLADLQDRQGIKQGFEDVDCDIRHEIVSRMAEIIRLANEFAWFERAKVENMAGVVLCRQCDHPASWHDPRTACGYVVYGIEAGCNCKLSPDDVYLAEINKLRRPESSSGHVHKKGARE